MDPIRKVLSWNTMVDLICTLGILWTETFELIEQISHAHV